MTNPKPSTPTEASIRAEMDHAPPIDTSHLKAGFGPHWTEPAYITTLHGPALLWGSLDGRHIKLRPIQPLPNHAPSAWWVWEVVPYDGPRSPHREDRVVSSAEAARWIRKHLKALGGEEGFTFTYSLDRL